ncbi:GntR family transcriptional regulator [Phreatobacter stygius]|nr:GntR family transcriptional regulator [Phreatobacter stygius]
MTAGRPEQKRHLAAEMAAAIRDGAYRPGEWLRQIDLEERFGAKRFDVRSALSELAVRGTVEHVVNRGYRIAVPDMVAIREVLAIRILVEVEAARQALPHIGPAELARIRTLQQAFETAIAHGSRVDQAHTNAAFHDAIYGHAPNRSLAELTTEMRNRSIRWPIALWPSHAALEKSAADHRAIVAALEAGDVEALVEAVRRHITGSAANYPSIKPDLG